MRLSVQVLPLAPENAHGPSRAQAMAHMAARKFALPVSLDDTFGELWPRIEERYKKNYLLPHQASCVDPHSLCIRQTDTNQGQRVHYIQAAGCLRL